MILTKYCLYKFEDVGDGESGPLVCDWLDEMYDTEAEAEAALANCRAAKIGAYVQMEQVSEADYTAFKDEQEYIKSQEYDYDIDI